MPLEKYAYNSKQHIGITTHVVNMIADSIVPLDFVESSGFRNLMNYMDPKYRVPSRRTITRHLIKDLKKIKQSIRNEIKQLLDECISHKIHATVDLWSSRALDPILGIRFHYVGQDFTLRVKTVAFLHFGERHTASNISSAFEEILSEYGLNTQSLGYVVTDNASNMIKAFKIFSLHSQLAFSELKTVEATPSSYTSQSAEDDEDENASTDGMDGDCFEEISDFVDLLSPDVDAEDTSADNDPLEVFTDVGVRLPCIAHTLQLAIKDGLKKVSSAVRVVSEASAVVSFFHRSLFWCIELKKLTGGRKLLSSVATRWNSNLIMLRRLGQEDVWKSVNEILTRARSNSAATPKLSVSRKQVLDLISIFEPFEEATNALQGDQITISQVIPALLGIDDVLNSLSTQFQSLQQHLRLALYDRFQTVIMQKEYVLSTLLDARYKLLPFSEATEANQNKVLKPMSKQDARRLMSEALERSR